MGVTSLPEYVPWQAMIARCCNRRNPQFKDYGGAGIGIVSEWRNSFRAFVEHIGPRPSREHSIDRIDNSRGYEPGNVRWSTPMQQSRNRACVINVDIDGVTKCVAEWCSIYGIPQATVCQRVKRGWDVKTAIITLPAPKTKVSSEMRAAIRSGYLGGVETHRSLAVKFNVSKSTINLVLKEVG